MRDHLTPSRDAAREHHVAALSAMVSEAHCLVALPDIAPYTVDCRRQYSGQAIAVVSPACTLEVSAVMRYCYQRGIAVVPQGGNTSLVGGAVPDDRASAAPCIVLSLSRLNRIEPVDSVNEALVVGAGALLSEVRGAADRVGLMFPKRAGPQERCQIGAAISTNAGGPRPGAMRALVLGLEVVLPSGEVWNGLRATRSDCSGLDLKQLFIGTEGTMGVITAAVLRLCPKVPAKAVALLAIPGPEQALNLLLHVKSRVGSNLAAFELISGAALEFVSNHLQDVEPLFLNPPSWVVLIELTATSGKQQDADDLLSAAVGDGINSGLIAEALPAQSEALMQRFWRLRAGIPVALVGEGWSVPGDISVPLSAIPEFLDEAIAQVRKLDPAIRMVIYGHLGEGCMHFNSLPPPGATPQEFFQRLGRSITEVIDNIALSVGGTITAEHGVGVAKRDDLLQMKCEVELTTAWLIKRAMDPKNLMNPGKVLPLMNPERECDT